jgi:hypothetical protein
MLKQLATCYRLSHIGFSIRTLSLSTKMAEPASKKAKPDYTFNVNKCTVLLLRVLCTLLTSLLTGLDKEFETKSLA